jgi:hypothetical protein
VIVFKRQYNVKQLTVTNGDEKRGIEDYKRRRDSKKRNEKLMNGGGTGSRNWTGENWEP